MLRRLLSFVALVIPGAVLAQSSAPYTRYAAAIVTKADSAVGFLTAQVDSESNESAVGALTAGAVQMQRLVAEFAATEAPGDLAAVHRDLVAALNLASSKADHAASLMQTALDTAGTEEQRTTAAETAQRELQDLQTAIGTYQQARTRAAAILRQHGATLPVSR